MNFLILLLLAGAQGSNTAVPIDQEPHHHQIFRNQRVRAFRSELGPHETMPLHRHDHDYLTVMLVNAAITNMPEGQQPIPVHYPAGRVRLSVAPLVHALRNDAPSEFRAVEIEFNEPQGQSSPPKDGQGKSHYCNPASKIACVDEAILFCTQKICVSDVTMGEGAVTTKHSHETDHMMVALTEYRLSDNVEGKGTNVRVQQSGGVEYLNAGITHQLTNISQHPIRFIVIVFK